MYVFNESVGLADCFTPMKSIIMLLVALVSVAWHCLQFVSAVEYAPAVRTRLGWIRGITHEVDSGYKVYFYQGIRYGKAERFQKPKFADVYKGVYNATHYRDACPQPGLEQAPFGTAQTTTMSEDCLFLNVWRPRRNKMMNFPTRSVIVFFVGAHHEKGTIFSQLYDARFFASRGDMVVVTVQHRVGPFGYLYGATENEPGNLGLHDQILALKWVYYNIARFSGDFNQVTIVGMGSGAMSVGNLILSPLAYRHFRRAIMMSGAPNSYYGGMNKTQALDRTNDLAVNLNCPTDKTMNETLTCLRSKSVEEIIGITKDAFLKNELFLPIYGDEALPLKATEALKQGKFNYGIDLMFGVVRNEGSTFAPLFLPEHDSVDGRSVKEAIKWMMDFYGKPYGDEVVEYYTSNLTEEATRDDMLRAVSQAWGDYHITCPTILFAESYAKQSPRHYYYSYRLVSPVKVPLYCSGWNGVCHGQDALFLFAGPNETLLNDDQRKLSKSMIQAWIGFARSGGVRTYFNGKQYWTLAFDPAKIATEPTTRFIALDAIESKMINDGYYTKTCGQFWKSKLFDNEEQQKYFPQLSFALRRSLYKQG